jgi:hypothetical protein
VAQILHQVSHCTTLHRWMEQARKTGIHSLVRFVRTLKQDLTHLSQLEGLATREAAPDGHQG